MKVVVSKIKSLRILNDKDDTEINSALIGIMLAKRLTALTVFAQLLTSVTVARHFSNVGLRYLRSSFPCLVSPLGPVKPQRLNRLPEGHWLKDAWSRQRISARGLRNNG